MNDRVVLTAFDPIEGRKRELASIEQSAIAFWDLSPDGGRIAFGASEERSGRIQLLSLDGEPPREISAVGWNHLESVAWAPDGKAFFLTGWASRGGPLLRISLDGRTEVLYRGRKDIYSPVPSPDGRYVAFAELTEEGNAYIIENYQ
jgi:Tol biopolymer transport system component